MGGKSSTPYPPECAKQIEQLEAFQFWTLETAKQLEKMNADRPVTQRPETDRKQLELARPPNPLEGLQLACEKYSGIFAKTNYGTTMDAYSEMFKRLNRNSLNSQMAAFEKAILPLKLWARCDFPALLKDLEKCQKLKKIMVRAQNAQKARPNDKRLQTRAQKTKARFTQLDEQCKRELNRMEKHFWHHTWLWQINLEIQIQHHQYCSQNIARAMDATIMEEPQTVETREDGNNTSSGDSPRPQFA